MKRSLKKRLQTFALTLATFVVVFVLYFGYKIIVVLFFQQVIDQVNPPFDFDAATKQIQRMQQQEKRKRQEEQKRQDKSSEPIGPTKPELQKVVPDLPLDPTSLWGPQPNRLISSLVAFRRDLSGIFG